MNNTLPNRIFLTGVPGSRWSGIAQTLESIPGFNTTDRTPERTYTHHSYNGHVGAYFGDKMEFECKLDDRYIDQAWTEPGGTRLVKSHNWAYVLPQVEHYFPDDWIMLVYRPDMASYAWWHEAGGFQIKYPCYDAYQDSMGMLAAITRQNQCILEYAHSKNATWHHFTPQWVESTFGHPVEITKTFPDILITVIKK
jgi:hypothetical protein